MPAAIRLLFGALLLIVLVGCRVDATVDIDVTEDGSGTVTLTTVFDAAASEALGGTDGLADRVFVSDLVDAGWTVTRPEVDPDGVTTIVASKPVLSADGFAVALDEIAGPGVFENFELVTIERFAERQQTLELDVDLRDGWSLFSDAGVAEALEGEPFGVPIDELTDGRPLDELLGVLVTAQVRATSDTSPSMTSATPRFDAEPTSMRIGSTAEASTAVLLRWIAYALGSLCLLALALAATGIVLERRAERLRPQATPSKLRSRIPGQGGTVAAGSTRRPTRSSRAAAPEGPVRLVVVEPLSVLYQQSESHEHYLLPFVRHNGGEERADVVLDAYDEVLRGRMPTAEFWKVAGVDADAETTDGVFLEMRWLRKGSASFLNELERRRIPIAAVSNDAASWSEDMRVRDRLTNVWPWLVSGKAGAAKPDTGMFERMRRETGTAYANCLYLDTNIEALDAARDLGMRTALFNADDLDLPDVVGHPVVSDLLHLVRRAT